MKYRISRRLTYFRDREQVTVPAGALVDVVRLQDVDDQHDRRGFERQVAAAKERGSRVVIFRWEGQLRGAMVGDEVEALERDLVPYSQRWAR